MKKIILLLSILSIVNFGRAQQAVTLDAKSISAPKYADLAAIQAAITSPTSGMMVYNIALNNYMYYDGTNWAVQGSASSPWEELNDNIVYGAADTYSANPNLAVTGPEVTSSINVPLTGSIGNANEVTISLSINHNFINDLKITLVSPSGTEIILLNNYGTAEHLVSSNIINFNGSSSGQIILTATIPSGTYLPSGTGAGNLNTLTGLSKNGNWVLKLQDTFPAYDDGLLVSWSLNFASSKKVGIGTMAPLAKLDIAGNIKITDGTQGANKVLTSDENGLASWQTPANGQPNGTVTGQMQYWDGSAWVNIPPGNEGQVLTYTSNRPEWATSSIMANLPSVTSSSISSITAATAVSGGTVTGQGVTAVTQRGICWSTSENPTIGDSYTTDGSGTGSFVSNVSGLLPATAYYVRAYAINNNGIAYGNELSFSTPPLGIGNVYQGGIIAYILQAGDSGYITGQQHGIIAAPFDQGTIVSWGCQGTSILSAQGITLGSGNQNTTAIMMGCGTVGIAARLCGDLVLNGYSDWYLPSKDELNKLYLNSLAIGGFSSGYYWSSTEGGYSFYAGNQNFSDGSHTSTIKNFSGYVRAIRSF